VAKPALEHVMSAQRLAIRPYRPTDLDACVSILRSNVPEHFFATDEPEFVRFLAQPGAYHVVVDDDDVVLACGGMATHREQADTAVLCYGLVANHAHRRGVGSLLMRYRLETWAQAHPETTMFEVNTSQKVRSFFERHGFTTKWTKVDGYGPGLDHVHMLRPVTPAS
jgi:predicted GNAT family N-acyltransferase